jgi:glycosyltransferase involved in cell wall biosynthesis
MHILHLVHQYMPEKVGGVELYTQALAQALSRRGHQVGVFARLSADGVGLVSRLDDQVRVWNAWHGAFTPGGRFLSTFTDQPLVSAFQQVVSEARPDLVHVQHLMGLPAAVCHTLAQQRIPYVVTLWDFWWVCANAQLLTNYSQEICEGPAAFLNCARCALARSGHPNLWPALPVLAPPLAWRNHVLRRVLAGAARIIAPAPFVRDWYARHGVAADKVVVLPPGLDYPDAGPKEAERPFRIGYIGGLSWQKGAHILVEAFAGLAGTAELWLAGDTGFDSAYVAHLRRLADSRVRFLGQIGRDALWHMLAQVDVVVVPSLWYETFCFVVSEAFAMGVPVIASDLGVLADRVRHEVDGLLTPPGDVAALRAALRRAQQEPALLARLRAGIGRPLTVAEHVTAVEALYGHVLTAAAQPPAGRD